jgi:hypothetical protein
MICQNFYVVKVIKFYVGHLNLTDISVITSSNMWRFYTVFVTCKPILWARSPAQHSCRSRLPHNDILPPAFVYVNVEPGSKPFRHRCTSLIDTAFTLWKCRLNSPQLGLLTDWWNEVLFVALKHKNWQYQCGSSEFRKLFSWRTCSNTIASEPNEFSLSVLTPLTAWLHLVPSHTITCPASPGFPSSPMQSQQLGRSTQICCSFRGLRHHRHQNIHFRRTS